LVPGQRQTRWYSWSGKPAHETSAASHGPRSHLPQDSLHRIYSF
jgi:hypothetical protein